jgi:hypothetical protein
MEKELQRIFVKNETDVVSDYLFILVRSSSMSSNSSTSTRSSITKSSSSSTNLTSQRTSKRRLSPSIVISLDKSSQKRRRPREQKQKMTSSSSATIIRIDDDDDENDIEQENGDDDDDVVVPIKFEEPKQQLNNIENLKSKSKINDEEIIICRSPPSVRKILPSPNKNHSKTSVNGTRKSNIQQVLFFIIKRKFFLNILSLF